MMIRHMQISTNLLLLVYCLCLLCICLCMCLCMCQLGLLAWSGESFDGGATRLFETGGGGGRS